MGGSLIGGIKETQEMLDFCGKPNIGCMVGVRGWGGGGWQGVWKAQCWVQVCVWGGGWQGVRKAQCWGFQHECVACMLGWAG